MKEKWTPPWLAGKDDAATDGKPPMKSMGKKTSRKPARKGFRKASR